MTPASQSTIFIYFMHIMFTSITIFSIRRTDRRMTLFLLEELKLQTLILLYTHRLDGYFRNIQDTSKLEKEQADFKRR